MADEAQAARQHLLESLSMYSDELMELLLAEEELPLELIYDVIAVGGGSVRVHAGVPGLGLSEQGRAAAAGRRGPLSAFAAGLPDQGPGRTTIRSKEVPLAPDPGQADRGDGLQDRRRPLRHADLHADLPGPVRQGRQLLQPAHRPQGAVQPHRADARRPARRHRRGRGRRHRGRAGRRLRQRRHLLLASTRIARWRACSCPSRSSAWPLPRPTATAPTG